MSTVVIICATSGLAGLFEKQRLGAVVVNSSVAGDRE